MRSYAYLVEQNRVRAESLQLKAGQKVGPWLVIHRDPNSAKSRYLVRCVCGKEYYKPKRDIQNGKSCGCLTRAILSEARKIHGMTDSPTWKSWKSMHDRCYLEAHKSYGDYGGRGISVCPDWFDFVLFYRDMGDRPSGTQLGRIDNGGGYSAANCRWETPTENANNRRNSRFLTCDGETRTISQWAYLAGMGHDTLRRRLFMGWSIEEAIKTPLKKQKNSRVQ